MTVAILALVAWPYSFQLDSAELVPVVAEADDDGDDRGRGDDGGNVGDDGGDDGDSNDDSNDKNEGGNRVDFGKLDDLEPMSADEEASVVGKWD